MNVTRRRKALSTTLATGLTLTMLSGCASTQSYSVGACLFGNCSNFKAPGVFVGREEHDDLGYCLYGAIDPGQRERIVYRFGFTRVGDTRFDGLYTDVEDQGTIETDAIEASVGYRYPFTDRFSAGGHVGAAYVDVSESEVFGGEPYSASASETIPYAGVEARYAFSDMWSVSAFYNNYPDVGKVGQTGEGNLHTYGISFDYRFGGCNSDE